MIKRWWGRLTKPRLFKQMEYTLQSAPEKELLRLKDDLQQKQKIARSVMLKGAAEGIPFAYQMGKEIFEGTVYGIKTIEERLSVKKTH